MKRKTSILTPLGAMIAMAEQDCLCELRFEGQKYASHDTVQWQESPEFPLFSALRRQLDSYFAGRLQTFDLPLAPRGTAFQILVWELLCTIPAGETTTYGALARQVAGKREGLIPAAQAVGGAVGHNPVAILIPCHRVIAANGSLTGYAAGLERKSALLALERRDLRS
jgi:methylated-DNA-[protein]-cysteine S-methyltransferase